ncbi:MAG: hypothetical protein CMB90_02615 [Flammeovirgaceae bacterium]|nr:hypothetical protein [Flammeovirgaceae bacterium]|tara:strand:- start:29 stop:745 length:717 start_codon:yes stop_codon:yes gene_type:complete
MKLGIDKIQKYGLESFVILFSIVLSFYIEGQRDLAEKNSDKNKLITDLINTIDEDQKQLEYIKSEMNKTVKLINEIQADINSQNSNLSRVDIINKISEIKVSYSFFPQEGIFNQLISTGSFELIENEDLKLLLLKIYNHQNNRNYAISNLIDIFSIEFYNTVYQKFRIDINVNNMEGEIYGISVVSDFNFNKTFYFSDEFYGFLTRTKTYANLYSRLLNDISENYKQAKIYSEYEINI